VQDQRNLLLAIVFSVVILLGFQFIFPAAPPPEPRPETADETADVGVPGPPPPAEAPGEAAEAAGEEPAVAPEEPRLTVDPGTDGRLIGSIALRGGRIDALTLADYREAVEPGSARIKLFTPPGSEHPYFAEFGWTAGGAEAAPALPGPDTLWRSDGDTLTPGRPVTLRWDNGSGLSFTRTLALDEDFMFTVTQEVRNDGDAPVTLYPYGLINRTDEPPTLGFWILHEGPLGVFNGTLKEVDYDDLREAPTIAEETVGGWIGITDKYWLAALIPDPEARTNVRFHYSERGGRERFQVELDRYEEELGIARFDLAVDFGWFYFLTKPFFYVLHRFYGWLGNFGLAILLLTVLIKLVFFPLANKSYVAMSKLKKLQPEMMKLRERYGDDKQKLNAEVMALYKREKANPLSGCLPIVIQIPVFFALYKVLFVSIEMRHAPFYGWVSDLSAPDPTSLFNLFGLVPFTPPDFLAIGVWPLVMGFSMFLQQKLNPTPPDPMQARVMMALPVVFTFILARFPAGLVIYWTWNNVLSIAQQWVIMRRMGVKA
jgi:YidC/Oxa1 family membrane protein insertase